MAQKATHHESVGFSTNFSSFEIMVENKKIQIATFEGYNSGAWVEVTKEDLKRIVEAITKVIDTA